MKSDAATDWNRVKTVETSLDIIELLRKHNGGDLTGLAAELELAKSTVYRHLRTLQDRGYVIREDGQFQVGLRSLMLGEYARRRNDSYLLAEKKVKELATETGERAQFMVEEHGYAVYAYIERGEQAVRTDPGPGSRTPIHAAASGKAILAHLPEHRIDEIIDRQGLPAMTEKTITDPDELYEELREIRETGIAYNEQEAIEGLLAIGVPIRSPDGGVIGALSISGPTHRIKGESSDEHVKLLLGASNELELNISYL